MAFFFFFQAEDGIRDLTVTGVQTCALPICPGWAGAEICRRAGRTYSSCSYVAPERAAGPGHGRSEEHTSSSHSQISYAVFCLKKKHPPQALSFDTHESAATALVLKRPRARVAACSEQSVT